MSADNEDPCRICWKPIIGKGFDIDTKPAHMTLTFSQIYSYISGFKPKNGSKVLCWGCSKDFIHAYKLTKQVEEKEKILSGEVPKIEKRKISKKRSFDESPTYETQNYDPPVQNLDFEMIVVKPEPISDSEGEYGSVDYGGNEFQNFSENEFEPENSNELSEPALLRPLVVIEDIKKELNDEGSSNDEKVKPKQETPIFVSQHKRSIQCILCDFTSPTVESYRAHARKMHPNVKMKCDGCSFTHHYITTLETHRKEMHWYKHKYVLKLANENENETKNEQTDDGDEKPLIAKQEIKSEPPCEVPQPIVKMQTAHGKPLGRKKQGEIKWPRKSKKIPIKCPLCPYSTIGKDNFRNHYRNQHNKQELKCDGCDAKFHLFYRLNRHREEEHGFEHEYIVDESLKVQPKPPKEVKERIFPCHLCDQTFKGPRKLINHQRDVHNYTKPKKPATRYTVLCTYCGKSLTNNTLEPHIRVIHPEYRDPYICAYCGGKSNTKKLLLFHMFKVHNFTLQTHATRNFMCTYCPKTFRTNHARKTHEKRKHTFDFQFPCTMCEKKFVDKHQLKVHMQRHAGIFQNKPAPNWNCDVCGTRFSKKSLLEEHLSTHYDNAATTLADSLAQNLAHFVAMKYDQNY